MMRERQFITPSRCVSPISTMLPMLRIVFYQQEIIWNDPAANRDKVKRAFEVVGQSADLLIVPETFTCGFGSGMIEFAESPQGPTWQFMRQMAEEHDAMVVGTWPVADLNAGGKPVVFNRLHWVGPDGKGGHYDKRHTFRMSSEAQMIERGSSAASFEWRGWRIRPAICYDLRFPTWLRNRILPSADGAEKQALLDYDLLLLCANWPASRRKVWNALLKARAIENLAFVAGVNCVGRDASGTSYNGGSAVIDFGGTDLIRAQDDREEVCRFVLDKDSLQEFRLKNPVFLDFD